MESLILLNTMENYPDGMTYYDLQQFGNVPHSKIYRIMKKMEQEGYLRKEEIVEIGRPKHLYFTTEKGLKYKESIRQEVRRYLKFARIRQLQPDFDYENKILRATLEVWSSNKN
ncbi:MAG: helix-turn-helix transcriptional regulator [Candidatus Lokiarchaeota archaeon]